MEELSFDWIQPLVNSLPEPLKRRRTIYQIAGFPKWENVNSNILAFYLDEKEEHGFKRMFFNSLIQLLLEDNAISIKDLDIFQTGYRVEREVYADNKRIDIVIKSREEVNPQSSEEPGFFENRTYKWAIIIENKLDAPLYNDLSIYWNSIKSTRKFGIILSLRDHQSDVRDFQLKTGITFFNILHSKLIEGVKKELLNVFLTSDDRHLLILKDYMENILNMLPQENLEIQERQFHLLLSYKSGIDKLDEIRKSLNDYAVTRVFNAMSYFGFKPTNTSTKVEAKHFYPDATFFKELGLKNPVYFRFWAYTDYMVVGGKIWIVFELFGEYSKYGSELKTKLKGISMPKAANLGKGGGDNYSYQHIINVDEYPLNNHSINIEDQVKRLLKSVYFNEDLNIVQQCTLWMEEILSKSANTGTSS